MKTRTAARPTRFPALLVSRVVEQCALGGVSLLLAARLGTLAFAPIGVLFVVNSAAVTLSDFGVGLAALRCPVQLHVATAVRRRMRLLNGVVLVVGVLVGSAVAGDTGLLIAASAAIWWSSSEAFVEKASAINRGRGARAASAELVGSVCFAGLAVAFAHGSLALAVIGGGLVTKHVLEALIARSHEDVFARDGVAGEIGALWVTQALAFAIANVDYLLVAIMLGPSAFSVYSIAYRLAVGVPATVAYVASRTAVAELASVDDAAARELRYGRYVRPLFVLGAAAGLAVAVCAPVLANLLGQQWAQVGPTAAVLAIALPWRMIAGQAGALAITGGNTRRLVGWELERLLGFSVAYSIAAWFGFSAFVASVSIAWIVGITLLRRTAERTDGIAAPTWLERAAVLACVLAVAATALWQVLA
ncbi:MAG: oligosaccharide flippase family protein [Acidimicrobiia bacterium]